MKEAGPLHLRLFWFGSGSLPIANLFREAAPYGVGGTHGFAKLDNLDLPVQPHLLQEICSPRIRNE